MAINKRIIAPDGLNQKGIDAFAKAGLLVDIPKSKEPAHLKDLLPLYNAVVIRSATKMTAELIEAGAKGKLEIIGRAGVGTDNVDIDAATSHGIAVKNAPSGNTVSTAELAITLIGMCARNSAQAHATLKYGQLLDIARKIKSGELDNEDPANVIRMIKEAQGGIWNKKMFSGVELQGKTLGVIGCGRIGSAVAARASAMGMRVIGFDPFSQGANPLITYVSKQDLLAESDFITLHPAGKGEILGANELALMKPTAFVINAARGPNVNPDALYEALKAKAIAGAGLDVFVGEPKEGALFGNKLTELDNVVFSPHLGASTKEAQEMTAVEMAAVIIGYLTKGDKANALNLASAEQAEEITHPLRVIHADIPGMFANVGSVLAQFGINILSIVSDPFKPAKGKETERKTATSTFLVYQQPPEEAVKEILGIEGVKRVIAEVAENGEE